MYDFPSLGQGIAIPYGIYDIGQNQGFVSVGTWHNTAEFAIAAIGRWWLMMEPLLYPDQKHMLIEADCGSSNGNRSRVWKMGLQHLASNSKFELRTKNGCMIVEKMLRSKDNFLKERIVPDVNI
jgi:hypothetical protein